MRISLILLVAAALVACESKPPPAPAIEERIAAKPADEPVDPGETAEPEAPVVEEAPTTTDGSFVLTTTALFRGASTQRRIEVDGKNLTNYLATLYRGERVVVLDREDEFSRVRASDGTEGFVRSKYVLIESLGAATITAAAKTFRRPALVALSQQEVPAGELLFVLSEKGEFSEVNTAGTRTAWVLSEALARDGDSYQVAKLLNRVRALKADEGKDHATEIDGLVELARANFSTSPILPALVREVDPEAADALEAQLSSAQAEANVMRFALHGSTPTLAWSPDGSKLLMNAAYEYFGFDEEEKRDFDELGIFVVDTKSGKKRRLWSKPGYHPLWLGDAQIAWGVSSYEDHNNAGLYLATLEGDDTVARRVEAAPQHVLNTRPAKGSGVVYFTDDWNGSSGWFRYDPREDRVSEVAKGDRQFGASWFPPKQHVDNQCPQSVEDVSVSVSSEGVTVRSEKYPDGKVLSAEGPLRFEPQAGSCDSTDAFCGPIMPCVSPDGRSVALIKKGDSRGKLEVEIHPL
ncbi:MAG: hypothetical protein AAFQ82_13470 [Myxococcota bacterium]